MAPPSPLTPTDATLAAPRLSGWRRECLISLTIAALLAGLTLGAGLAWQAQGLGWLAAGPLVVALGWCLAWGFVLVRHLHQTLTGTLGFWLVQGTLWHGSYRDGPMGGLETALLATWALALAGLAVALLALSLAEVRRRAGRARAHLWICAERILHINIHQFPNTTAAPSMDASIRRRGRRARD